jgi:hypothetical protein
MYCNWKFYRHSTLIYTHYTMGDSSITDLKAAFDLSDMYGKMGLYHIEWAGGLC